MAKTKNISTEDYQRYQNELILAMLKKIDGKIDLMNKRFDTFEACMYADKLNKDKPSPGYTTEEVLEIVPVCRNTLLNYRNAGIIVEKRKGRKLIYTDEDIEILKKQI